MFLKAGLVYPVSSAPVPGGCIAIEGGRVMALGCEGDFSPRSFKKVLDLSGHIVMPGFVNAHSHLQLAAARGKMRPDGGFAGWIRQVIAFNASVTDAERETGMRDGIAEMLSTGTTAVGDIVGDARYASPLAESPLRSVVFIESIAPSANDAGAAAHRVGEQIDALSRRGMRAGISPHAPHTVSAELFKKLAAMARRQAAPITSHVAESPEEDEYVRKGTGTLRTLFDERGIPARAPAGVSPVKYLHQCGALAGLLAVHLNTVDDGDLATLRETDAVPVFCPGSSRWFGRERVLPLERMFAMGMGPALGTDSLASNGSLSMLDEIRHAALWFPALAREKILEAATANGARALGLACGAVAPGRWADLIAIRWDGAEDPLDRIFRAPRPDFVMIDGEMVAA